MKKVKNFFIGICFYLAYFTLSFFEMIGLIITFVGSVIEMAGEMLSNAVDGCECDLINKYYGHKNS